MIDVRGDRLNQLAHWLRRGVDLLFPPRCVSCSRLGTWFCGTCAQSVDPIPQPICPRCGLPSQRARLCLQCFTSPGQLDAIHSVALHTGPLRKAIHHFKFRGRRELSAPLGQMLFDYWVGSGLSADLVIPVPLHLSRQKARGFNQAGLLAAALAEHAQLPLNERDLIRTRATAPQVGLAAAARKANVSNAFAWMGGALDDVRLLLIDDVCTTGATLEACAAALVKSGAQSVCALTLARPLGFTD